MKGYLKIIPPSIDEVQNMNGFVRAGFGTMVYVVTEDGQEIKLEGVRSIALRMEVDSAIMATIETYAVDLPESFYALLEDAQVKFLTTDQTYHDIKNTELLNQRGNDE